MTLSALQDALKRLDTSIDAERRAIDTQRRLLAAIRPIRPATLSLGAWRPDDFTAQRLVLRAHQVALSALLARRDRVNASIHDAKVPRK